MPPSCVHMDHSVRVSFLAFSLYEQQCPALNQGAYGTLKTSLQRPNWHRAQSCRRIIFNDATRPAILSTPVCASKLQRHDWQAGRVASRRAAINWSFVNRNMNTLRHAVSRANGFDFNLLATAPNISLPRNHLLDSMKCLNGDDFLRRTKGLYWINTVECWQNCIQTTITQPYTGRIFKQVAHHYWSFCIELKFQTVSWSFQRFVCPQMLTSERNLHYNIGVLLTH